LVWASYPFNLNLGWYAPVLVVYSTGQAIVEVEGGSGSLPAFRSLQFTGPQLAGLQDQIARDSAFWAADDSIDLAKGASDAIESLITVALPSRSKTIVVRGGDWNSPYLNVAPAALKDLYRRLSGPDSGGGLAWLPDSVEVVLQPAHPERCAAPSRHPGAWPATLPLPSSPSKDAAGTLRFRLSSDYYQTIVELREKHGSYECTPLTFDSRYRLLGFRLPFPSEHRWPL